MNIPFKSYWLLLARHIAPQKARFVLLTVLLLSSIGLQLINPQIVRLFIDQAMAGQGRLLLWAALAFIGIALLQKGVAVAATYTGENVAWTATNALRAELTHHCLGLDMRFHAEHPPGELIQRIDGDVSSLSKFFSQLVIRLLGSLILLLGILIALFWEDWRLGLALTAFALIALLALNRMRGIAVPFYTAREQAHADLFGALEEQLSGAEDLRSSGGEGFALCELHRMQSSILKHSRKASLAGVSITILTGSLITLADIAAVVSGYFLHRAGLMTIGTVYLVVHYINLLRSPLWSLAHEVEGLQTIGASIERLNDLRRHTPTIGDGPGAHLPPGPLPLTFEAVSFSYIEQEPVLQNVNLHLPAGAVLGLLGRTGSGKTTLARLILRLYDPTDGKITLNDTDIRQLHIESLRRRVALVTQDVQLFRASVRDNLAFFDRRISDERILAALHDLELGEWYGALPQGLDTMLESGGRGLSAGEAQLLALTRVFLRDPSLIILDEASSRLDPATEQRIERAIDRLLQNRTAIIIAHRLHTVHRADSILILEDGQVGEYGERERLSSDPTSRFYHLLQTGLEQVLV